MSLRRSKPFDTADNREGRYAPTDGAILERSNSDIRCTPAEKREQMKKKQGVLSWCRILLASALLAPGTNQGAPAGITEWQTHEGHTEGADSILLY